MQQAAPKPASQLAAQLARLSVTTLRIIGLVLLAYVVALAVYGYYHYEGTRSRLLTYGISEATAAFAATVVLLIALGVPAFSLVRIIAARGRPADYAFVLILPLLTWLTSLIPANFDARTGKVLRFCADRPDGSLFCLDHEGIDPLTQRKLLPIDSNTAEMEFRKQKGLAPKLISKSVSSVVFFDPLSGQPKVFLAKNDTGCFDIFDNPGVHPQTGDRLMPATKDLIRQLSACRRKESDSRPQFTSEAKTPRPAAEPAMQDARPNTNAPKTEPNAPAGPRISSQPIVGTVGQRHVFTLSASQWSPPLRIPGGTCFFAIASQPGTPRERVQVRGPGDTDWRELAGAAGRQFEWVRVTSSGPGDSEITVEIRRDGQC